MLTILLADAGLSGDAQIVGIVSFVLMVATFFFGRQTVARKDGREEGERDAKIASLEVQVAALWKWKDAKTKEDETVRGDIRDLRKDVELLTKQVTELNALLRQYIHAVSPSPLPH